jgi:alpha-mannosidase
VPPLVSVDDDGVIVESVKLADDRSGDLIVRVYEALGRRATATVRASCATTEVDPVDLLERRRDEPALAVHDGAVTVELRPFQILTLRFSRG